MDWQDLARHQAGAIDRRQLSACGLSEGRIDRMVADRRLVQLLPCVYSPRPVPSSIAQREWAAVLWSGGVLSHRSAARRWGLPAPAATRPDVTVGDRRFRGRAPGVRVHRVELGMHEAATAGGAPVTSRPRTVVDLLRTEPYSAARDLRDRALAQGWVDEREIVRSFAGALGRTGNVQLRRLVSEIEAGVQAESERRLHRILRAANITGWVAQYRVRVSGRTVFIDVAFPEQRVAIEVDGRRYHGDWADRFDDDRDRQNALAAAGWRVLRFTWTHLADPEYVVAQIVQLLAA